MTGRHPPSFKWGKDPATSGEKERKKVFQSKKTASSCLCCSAPFTPVIKFVPHKNSNETSALSLRPTFSEPQYQRTSCGGVCVTLASSLWGGRGHLRLRYSSSLTSQAKTVPWRCLAVAWAVVFFTLLNTPSTWKLSRVSGRLVSSLRLHDATGRSSSNIDSVLAALPPLLHRQQASVQASEKEIESTPAARVSVSAGAADGAWSPSVSASPGALTTFVSSATPTVTTVPLPRQGVTDASTTTAAAFPTATATAIPTEAAVAAPPVAGGTVSVPAPAAPALVTLTAAAPEHAAPAALPISAAEALRTGIVEVAYAAAGTRRKPAGARGAAAGEGAAVAAARGDQTAAGRVSPEEGRGGDTRGAGEEPATTGGENEAEAATTMEAEVGPSGAGGVYLSGGRGNGNIWRREGRASFLSKTTEYTSRSATLTNAEDKVGEVGAPENAVLAAAEEPTPEAGEREEAAPAAVGAPHAAEAAPDPVDAGGRPAEGTTATWRAAAAAQKKALEEEAQAARDAASKPSPAELEATKRKEEASQKEAAASAEATARNKEEESGGGSDSVTDSCAAVLEPMVRRGLSRAAAEKIKHMLAVERFVEKVSELRRIAARKCLAGEEDACETPEKPAWQTAGLSKPSEAPTITRFTLPAARCPAPGAGISSSLQGPREEEQVDSSGAASTGYNAKQVRGGFDGETEKHRDVMEVQGNDESAAVAATASFLVGSEVKADEGKRRIDEETKATENNDAGSAFLLQATTRPKEQKIREHSDFETAAGERATDRSLAEAVGHKDADIGRPPPATPPTGKSSRSVGIYGGSNRTESKKGRKGSFSRSAGSTSASSDGGSSGQDSSSYSIETRATSNSRSNDESDNSRKKRRGGNTFPLWGDTWYPEVREDATVEEEQLKETVSKNSAAWRKRRNFHRSRRAPLQLRMQPDEGPRIIRPLALVQARSRGIFDTLQSLFGNGMDISNPQNFDGGNQGSFFNFMYPSDTDYPWACVCDENQWKRWENKEIEAVPCRNQVDTSAQGITAACNPLNHQMNAASPSMPHANAIILGLLSAATVVVSSAV